MNLENLPFVAGAYWALMILIHICQPSCTKIHLAEDMYDNIQQDALRKEGMTSQTAILENVIEMDYAASAMMSTLEGLGRIYCRRWLSWYLSENTEVST